MIKQRKLYFFIFSFYLLLFSSCTQYSDSKNITLRLKFPTASKSSSGALTKPAGTDESYIPPFIDKIDFSLERKDEEQEPILIERYRKLGDLSTEYDLGVLPWGQYEIEATAYICKCTEMDTCANCDDSDPYNDEYTLTHKFSNPALVLGSGYENYEIDLEMDVNYTVEEISGSFRKSGVTLDTSPISIDPTGLLVLGANPPETDYCLAVDGSGDFLIAWVAYHVVSDTLTILNLRTKLFDSHGKLFDDRIVYTAVHDTDANDPAYEPDELYISESCSFLDSSVYIPFQHIAYSDYPSNINHLKVARFDTESSDLKIFEIYSSQNNSDNYKSCIDLTDDLTVLSSIAFSESSSSIRADILNLEAEDYIMAATQAIAGYTLSNSKVKIIDENRFMLVALINLSGSQGFKIIGRILNKNGENVTGIVELSPNISDYPRYSLSKIDTGYVLFYDYFSSSNYVTIRKLFFDQNLNLGNSTSVFAYYLIENRLYPIFNNFGNNKYSLVWMRATGNYIYSIYYLLPSYADYRIKSNYETNLISQCGEMGEICSISVGSPHAVVNDDGFAVISWYYDGNFYFKRYIF